MDEVARSPGLTLLTETGPVPFAITAARLDPDEEFLGNLTLSLRCRRDHAPTLGKKLRISLAGGEPLEPIASSVDATGSSLVFHSAELEELARRGAVATVELVAAGGEHLTTVGAEIASEAVAAPDSVPAAVPRSGAARPSPAGVGAALRMEGSLLTDVVLSVLGTVWALVRGWSVADAVWALWIYALCIGGALIAVPFVLGSVFAGGKDETGSRLGNATARFLVGCSLLAVFLLFARGHLRFLEEMIPLPRTAVPLGEAGGSSMLQAAGTLLTSYAVLLVLGAVEQIVALIRQRSGAALQLLLRPWLLIAKVHLLILVTTFLEPLQGSVVWTAVLIFFCLAPVETVLLRLHRVGRGG